MASTTLKIHIRTTRFQEDTVAQEVRSPAREPALKIAFGKKISMVANYIRDKLKAQLGSVAFISLYLLFFQVFILRAPLQNFPGILGGILAVVLGLAAFMEGLFLGIMPLGERCGLRLPVRVPLFVLLVFSAVLGLTATLAEPAISLLQQQGSAVTPWGAPLQFWLLNEGSLWLIAAVAVGVSMAVVLGVLRFLRGWSIKPLIFIILPLVLALSIAAWLDPRCRSVVALAWDTGGVATGPVTVPLILALGVGVSRLTGSDDKGTGGLGLVTLASALPVGAVLVLALALTPQFPAPASAADFFSPLSRDGAIRTLGHATAVDERAMAVLPAHLVARYYGPKADSSTPPAVDGGAALPAAAETSAGAGPTADASARPPTARSPATGTNPAAPGPAGAAPTGTAAGGFLSLARSALAAALGAIIPLSLVLIAALKLLVREKLGRRDEIFLGLALSLLGFFLFTIGMDRGLSALGKQTGSSLPRAWLDTERPDLSRKIPLSSRDALIPFVDDSGELRQYVPVVEGGEPRFVPFDQSRYDPASESWIYVPSDPALLDELGGYLLVLLFVFVMGLGATFAEPSLNALGKTLEDLTTGTYKSSFLVSRVSFGVGIGMIAGFARILFDLPFLPILGGLYVLTLILTLLSPDDIGAIAWDSAGVTTGPITVPLVMSAGLGIGGHLPGIDPFGILALTSVCPVISVLLSGIVANLRRSRLGNQSEEAAIR